VTFIKVAIHERDFLYPLPNTRPHTRGFSSRKRPSGFSPGQHTSSVMTGGGCWLFSWFCKDFHNYLRMEHDTFIYIFFHWSPPTSLKKITVIDNTYAQQEIGKIRLQDRKRIDFCSGFLCLSHLPWPQGRRHTRWEIPQGLDCSGRNLRKSRSCVATFSRGICHLRLFL
jgi:hypothetical protein